MSTYCATVDFPYNTPLYRSPQKEKEPAPQVKQSYPVASKRSERSGEG